MTYSDGGTYEGAWSGGKPSGYGIRVMGGERTGEVYKGFYSAGERTGFGIVTYPDGSTYEGMWYNSEFSGYGIHTSADGEIFDGTWRKNQRYGKGVLTEANGKKYDVEYGRKERNFGLNEILSKTPYVEKMKAEKPANAVYLDTLPRYHYGLSGLAKAVPAYNAVSLQVASISDSRFQTDVYGNRHEHGLVFHLNSAHQTSGNVLKPVGDTLTQDFARVYDSISSSLDRFGGLGNLLMGRIGWVSNNNTRPAWMVDVAAYRIELGGQYTRLRGLVSTLVESPGTNAGMGFIIYTEHPGNYWVDKHLPPPNVAGSVSLGHEANTYDTMSYNFAEEIDVDVTGAQSIWIMISMSSRNAPLGITNADYTLMFADAYLIP
jgi:hypothetical protein